MDSCNCTGASALLVRLCGKAQRLRIVLVFTPTTSRLLRAGSPCRRRGNEDCVFLSEVEPAFLPWPHLHLARNNFSSTRVYNVCSRQVLFSPGSSKEIKRA